MNHPFFLIALCHVGEVLNLAHILHPSSAQTMSPGLYKFQWSSMVYSMYDKNTYTPLFNSIPGAAWLFLNTPLLSLLFNKHTWDPICQQQHRCLIAMHGPHITNLFGVYYTGNGTMVCASTNQGHIHICTAYLVPLTAAHAAKRTTMHSLSCYTFQVMLWRIVSNFVDIMDCVNASTVTCGSLACLLFSAPRALW